MSNTDVGNIDIKSYREQTVDLKGGMVNEVYFIDTKPNFMYITNLGTNDILIDDQPNVTGNSYEVLAGSLMKRSLVKPLGLTKLYIYTESDGRVKIESGVAKLSLSDIPMTQIVATLSNSLSISKVDVDHILNELPAGDNLIGKVEVVAMPDMNVVSLPPLPAGTNNIGDVDVVGWSNMITLLTDIKNLLTDLKTEQLVQSGLLTDIKTNTTP